MPTLDFEAVQAFVLVADLKSFTRAAEAMDTTQSAVSLKIRPSLRGLAPSAKRQEGSSLGMTMGSISNPRMVKTVLPETVALVFCHRTVFAAPVQQQNISKAAKGKSYSAYACRLPRVASFRPGCMLGNISSAALDRGCGHGNQGESKPDVVAA